MNRTCFKHFELASKQKTVILDQKWKTQKPKVNFRVKLYHKNLSRNLKSIFDDKDVDLSLFKSKPKIKLNSLSTKNISNPMLESNATQNP